MGRWLGIAVGLLVVLALLWVGGFFEPGPDPAPEPEPLEQGNQNRG